MDYQRLREMADLFRPAWQNAIIECLRHEGPQRFSELRHSLTRYTGRPPSEGHLVKLLKELNQYGFVNETEERDAPKLHVLTETGRARAGTLIAVSRVLDERQAAGSL